MILETSHLKKKFSPRPSKEKQTNHKWRCFRKQCYNAWRAANKLKVFETKKNHRCLKRDKYKSFCVKSDESECDTIWLLCWRIKGVGLQRSTASPDFGIKHFKEWIIRTRDQSEANSYIYQILFWISYSVFLKYINNLLHPHIYEIMQYFFVLFFLPQKLFSLPLLSPTSRFDFSLVP